MEKKLEGFIVWLEPRIFKANSTKKESIYQSTITDAVLTETGLTFSCRNDSHSCKVKLRRIKDTNFQGQVSFPEFGDSESCPVYLQVFENRIGLMLEGEWNEDDTGPWWCVVRLHYV